MCLNSIVSSHCIVKLSPREATVNVDVLGDGKNWEQLDAGLQVDVCALRKKQTASFVATWQC